MSWPPLDSDPEIFNDYFGRAGMKGNCRFEEIFGLDE